MGMSVHSASDPCLPITLSEFAAVGSFLSERLMPAFLKSLCNRTPIDSIAATAASNESSASKPSGKPASARSAFAFSGLKSYLRCCS